MTLPQSPFLIKFGLVQVAPPGVEVNSPVEAGLQHPETPGAQCHDDPLLVLQKVPSEANPKVRNHGEGPY